jgi:lysophospholipase L1-like esterase
MTTTIALGLVTLLALSAMPAHAEKNNAPDPTSWEALKNTEAGPIILKYREQPGDPEAIRHSQTLRAGFAKKGFLVGKNQKLICFGDSITEASEGYVAIMQSLVSAAYPDRQIEVINSGISGHKVTSLLERVDRDVIDKKPDWVTICIGINDVWHGVNGVPLAEYVPKLDELVAKILKADIRVVLVTTPVIGEDPENAENIKLRGYNLAINEVAKKYGLMVVPMNQKFIGSFLKGREANPDFKLTVDGVHPNHVGHTVMALTILKTLRFQEAE